MSQKVAKHFLNCKIKSTKNEFLSPVVFVKYHYVKPTVNIFCFAVIKGANLTSGYDNGMFGLS